ncbi:MAG: DUF512 domain-containing protein [Chitinispirillaceae bacterium]|nr:DUF512 domain-containing protein [Chitinispirillaceae bacterium]
MSVTVCKIAKNSPFYRAGIRKGDKIFTINGEEIKSELDFFFFSAASSLEIETFRKNTILKFNVNRKEGAPSGIYIEEGPIKRCTNRCIFCFIDQMPKGLRKSLYIKDEDLRLSLLNGNYVTLSSFKKDDLENIARISLSPLYISVHATDNKVRREMLGNSKAPDIMEQLTFLAENGIKFHTQIVVCPNYNDRDVLKKTVIDLLSFDESLLSIAVVPVGLTKFRKNRITPVNSSIAKEICNMIEKIGEKALKRDGIRKVFLADEFFIKAGREIPELSYYEDFPQIENGVGIVRQFLDQWEKAKKRIISLSKLKKMPKKRIIVVTSVLASMFVDKVVKEIISLSKDREIILVPVVNYFFGESVTVAGLLTATDVIKQVKKISKSSHFDEVILPAVMFNYSGFTLDGYSVKRIEKSLGIKTRVVSSVEEIVLWK